MRLPTWFQLCLGLIVAFHPIGKIRADDRAAPLLFDAPALEQAAKDGLHSLADGTFEIWLWGKGPELSITIGERKFDAKASKDRFAWYHPGQVKLQKDQRVAVSFPKNDDAADLMNVPGYFALSPDPNFDPKRLPLGGLRTLYDASGFKPPATKEEWLKRRDVLRRQILVSNGLWPMPPKGDLKPQIYGKMMRDGYSIEKVVLETFPGFYLSGNLYRPAPWVPIQTIPPDEKVRRDAWEKNRAAEKKPAILCPHGHWAYGRFEPEVQKRCKQLARMGAVVFAYDIVGYADSKPFGHKFLDPQLDLMGLSMVTLQTWDSIRSLDFLTSLADVDLDRVACTGASGGGTQTFLLTAIDDRVKVAAPTVMVSQDMQGGCQCENASGMRVGTDNSELAALFAPKPQIMVCCTGDWTHEFPTKGFPEVQAIYKLFDAADRVETDIFDFPHNYNKTTRERVYAFFSKHLFNIDPALSQELPLEAESQETISTWDAEHPRPANAVDVAGLKTFLTGVVTEQAGQFKPTTADGWKKTRGELAAALDRRLACNETQLKSFDRATFQGEFLSMRFDLNISPMRHIRGVVLLPPPDGKYKARTIVVHPDGMAGLLESDGKPKELVRELLVKGHAVEIFDPYLVGNNRQPFTLHAPAGISHFSCYNASAAVERVREIVFLANRLGPVANATPETNLVGVGSAGPLCLLARTQLPKINHTVIDANSFDYHADSELPAEQVLPGIVRLGGLRAVAALAAPGRLFIHNTGGDSKHGLDTSWIEAAYRLEGAEKNLKIMRSAATTEQIIAAARD